MVSIETVAFAYNREKKFRFPDFTVDRQPLLVLGESGVGKTTLLHLIAGFLKPENGSIVIDGKEITELKPSRMDRFRGRHIGMVFQRPQFIRALNLKDNLRFIQHLSGKVPDSSQTVKVLGQLGLADKQESLTYRLSQGEQQRAAIAMALINRPSLILADEPTSSLDDKNCHSVVALLQEQADTYQADLIIITHDQRLKSAFQQTIVL